MKMIAPIPPMGWNAWNTFSCNISEKLIKEVSDYVKVRDLWKHEDIGVFKGAVTSELKPHCRAFY